MITPTDIQAAVHIVDTSRAAEILSVGARTDKRGRKDDPTKLRLLLIGLFLSVHVHGKGVVTEAHKLLTTELPFNQQWELGVRRWKTNSKGEKYQWVIPIADFYELTNKINHRLGYGHGKHPDLEEDERLRRHDVIRSFNGALMDVFDLGWTTNTFAMDATGIWSWGKGKGRPTDEPSAPAPAEPEAAEQDPAGLAATSAEGTVEDSADCDGDLLAEEPDAEEEVVVGDPSLHDPDGAWGVKTSKKGKDESFFGYHEHTLVQVPGNGQTVDDEPPLIRGYEVTPANADVVVPSLALIDDHNARADERTGQYVKDLNVDRHYHYKHVERWRDQLVARGVTQHHDLRIDEQGFTEDESRVRWGAGHAHCPATADELGVIPRPGPAEPAAKHKAFAQKIELREHFALRRITGVGPDGSHRAECPALAGLCGCPLRAGTVEAAVQLGLPVITRPPDPERDGEPLPACCTQRSVSLHPPASVRKLMQPNYWGRPKWLKMFNKRTYVEGSYGNRKNPNTENMRRGQFRVTGLAWVNIMVGLSAASYNLRVLRNWHERTGKGDPAHPLLKPVEHPPFMFIDQATHDNIAHQYRPDAA